MLKFAKLSDDFGCPRSSYDNTHLEVHEDARQSQRKADRQARSAKAHASSEMENRAKAARFEREISFEATRQPLTRSRFDELFSMASFENLELLIGRVDRRFHCEP